MKTYTSTPRYSNHITPTHKQYNEAFLKDQVRTTPFPYFNANPFSSWFECHCMTQFHFTNIITLHKNHMNL